MPPLEINPQLQIPEDALTFLTSRSGGPGGQNVNKLETKVTVRLDLATPALSDAQRALIGENLATRITRTGHVQVSAQRHRTQAANREAALARMAELLQAALAETAPRRPTKPSRAAKARRLEAKRRQSKRKQERGGPLGED